VEASSLGVVFLAPFLRLFHVHGLCHGRSHRLFQAIFPGFFHVLWPFPLQVLPVLQASSSGGTAGSGAMFVLVVQGNLASWKRPPSERAIYSNVSMSHRLRLHLLNEGVSADLLRCGKAIGADIAKAIS
jgi:hypothetical protein